MRIPPDLSSIMLLAVMPLSSGSSPLAILPLRSLWASRISCFKLSLRPCFRILPHELDVPPWLEIKVLKDEGLNVDQDWKLRYLPVKTEGVLGANFAIITIWWLHFWLLWDSFKFEPFILGENIFKIECEKHQQNPHFKTHQQTNLKL